MSKEKISWLKSGSYSLLGYGAQLGLAFVSFLLLIRIMPEYEFGVWVLFLTVTSFAEMARIGLTQNAIVKFCVEDETAYDKVAMAGLVLNTICSVLLSVLLLVLTPLLSHVWDAPELMHLMWWYLPFALLHGTARYIDNLQMARHDFKGIFWSKTAFGVVFLLSSILVWRIQPDALLEYLPGLQVLAAIPSLLISFLYRKNQLRWERPSWPWVRRIFHFGKYVLGTNFSSMLFNKTDIMMVGGFLNPVAVAVYNVASRITNYMEVPMSGIAQAVYPRIAASNQEDSKEDITQLYEKSVGILLAVTLPMGLIALVFAKPIILLLAGKNYLSAAPVLSILVVAVLAKPWGRLFGITLDAIGKPQLNFKMLLAGLVMNVLLNGIMIPVWGVQGAAMASLSSIWIITLAGQWIIIRLLPISQLHILQHAWAFYRRPMARLNPKQL